jgi:pSer/pThr/pTyr-binding forkhead associated (FHA) protein
MSFRLVPLIKGKVPVIPLTRPALLIGRHSECDVQLANSPVSRFHCCLALAYDRIVIRDLGSRNGLRVNGRLVEEARLYSGDEVAIGPVIYRLMPDPDEPGQAGAALRQSPPTPATLGVGSPSPRASLPSPSSSADDAELEIELAPLDDD